MTSRSAENLDNVFLSVNKSKQAGRESSQRFSHKLMDPFLVIQCSMDEKDDKKGYAFSKESGDMPVRWTEANILASSY